MEITEDIANIINAVHTQFSQSEPALAEAFKTVFTKLATHPSTPLWKPREGMCGTLIMMPRK